MLNATYSETTPELAAMRKKLALDIHDAFPRFSERAFADGALTAKEVMKAFWLAAKMRAGGAYAPEARALAPIAKGKHRSARHD